MPKVDRRIAKSQEAIKKALIELMSQKSFDTITIQDIADRANVNRGTVYLHYLDKFDLLDKIVEEYLNRISNFCELAIEVDFIESTVHSMEYFEKNYIFFSTMLASEGGQCLHKRFLNFNIQEFKKNVDITKGKNYGQSEEVVVQFVANAYVGAVEWWLKNKMPYPPRVMAEKMGDLLKRIV